MESHHQEEDLRAGAESPAFPTNPVMPAQVRSHSMTASGGEPGPVQTELDDMLIPPANGHEVRCNRQDEKDKSVRSTASEEPSQQPTEISERAWDWSRFQQRLLLQELTGSACITSFAINPEKEEPIHNRSDQAFVVGPHSLPAEAQPNAFALMPSGEPAEKMVHRFERWSRFSTEAASADISTNAIHSPGAVSPTTASVRKFRERKAASAKDGAGGTETEERGRSPHRSPRRSPRRARRPAPPISAGAGDASAEDSEEQRRAGFGRQIQVELGKLQSDVTVHDSSRSAAGPSEETLRASKSEVVASVEGALNETAATEARSKAGARKYARSYSKEHVRFYGGVLTHNLNKLVELCTIVDEEEEAAEAEVEQRKVESSFRQKWGGILRRTASLGRSQAAATSPIAAAAGDRSPPPAGSSSPQGRKGVPWNMKRRKSKMLGGLFGNSSSGLRAVPEVPEGRLGSADGEAPLAGAGGLLEAGGSAAKEPSMSGQGSGHASARKGAAWPVRRQLPGGRHGHEGGAAGEAEGADEDWEERPLAQATKWLVFAKVGMMLLLALSEVAVGFELQVFWHECDFMCRTGTGQLNVVSVVLLSALLAAHCAVLGSKATTRDYNGSMLKWRIFLPDAGTSNLDAAFHLVYLFILLASVAVFLVHINQCPLRSCQDMRMRVIAKAHLVVHLARILCTVRNVALQWTSVRTRLQNIVSVNKRRFVDVDLHLDLDLTYIADRLIALALPCVDSAIYRNDIRQVARFFAGRHYGGFVVTNLCEAFEESGNGNYDCALLYNQVQKLPMRDHNAPALCTLVLFCESATAWLNQRKTNIVAVHCQGGKGRTGTFCSALMLWVGLFKTAKQASEYFARRRTRPLMKGEELQGINAPCQHRYVHYLERALTEGIDIWRKNPLLMTKITICGRPHYQRECSVLAVLVETAEGVLYDHCKASGPLLWGQGGPESMEVTTGPLLLQGDVTIRVFLLDEEPEPRTRGEVWLAGRRVRYGAVRGKCVSFVTFNTAFHGGDARFGKSEVDEAYKDARHAHFPPDYAIELGLFRGGFADAMAHIGSQHLGGLGVGVSPSAEGKGRRIANLLYNTTRALLDSRRRASLLPRSSEHSRLQVEREGSSGSPARTASGASDGGSSLRSSKWKTVSTHLDSIRLIARPAQPRSLSPQGRAILPPRHPSPGSSPDTPHRAGSGVSPIGAVHVPEDADASLSPHLAATASDSETSPPASISRRHRSGSSLWRMITVDRISKSASRSGPRDHSPASSASPAPPRHKLPATQFSRRGTSSSGALRIPRFLGEGTTSNLLHGVTSRSPSPAPRGSHAAAAEAAAPAELEGAELRAETTFTAEHVGLATALRELALWEMFEGVMWEACGDPAVFKQGEVILDSRESTEVGVLFYVVRGLVRCEPLEDRRGAANSALGMLRDPTMEVVGARQLFAVGETLLGEQGKATRVRYLAKTEEVAVLRLRLNAALWDSPAAPTTLLDGTVGKRLPRRRASSLGAGAGGGHRLTHAQRCVVYEFLARDMTGLSSRFAERLSAMTETAQVKHDKTKSTLAEKKRLISNIIARHSLPVIEMVLSSCEVTLQGPRKFEGYLLLFNHWLIFTPFNSGTSGNRDLVFRIEDIAGASCLYDTLAVELRPDEHTPRISEFDVTLRVNGEGSNDGGANRVLAERALMARARSAPDEGNEESPQRPSRAKQRRWSTSSEERSWGRAHLKHAALSLLQSARHSKERRHSAADDTSQSPDTPPARTQRRRWLPADADRSDTDSPKPRPAALSPAEESSSSQAGAGAAFREEESSRRSRSTPRVPASARRQSAEPGKSPRPGTGRERYSSDASLSTRGGGIRQVAGSIWDAAAAVRGGLARKFPQSELEEDRGFNFKFAESGPCSQMHAAIRQQLEFVNQERAHRLQSTDDLSVLRHYGYLTREESLSRTELERLTSLLAPANRRRFAAGETVIEQGEEHRHLIHILEGTLSVRNGDSILAMRNKGDLVGERSFMHRGNNGASAKMVAVTETWLLMIDYHEVERITADMPAVGASIFRSLAMNLVRRMHGQMLQLLSHEQHNETSLLPRQSRNVSRPKPGNRDGGNDKT